MQKRVRHVRFKSKSLPKEMVASLRQSRHRSRSKGGRTTTNDDTKKKPPSLRRARSSRRYFNRSKKPTSMEPRDMTTAATLYVLNEEQINKRSRARSVISSDTDEDQEWNRIQTRKRGTTSGPSKKEQRTKHDRMFINERKDVKEKSLDQGDEHLLQEFVESCKVLKGPSPTLANKITALNSLNNIVQNSILEKLPSKLQRKHITTLSSIIIASLNDRHVDVMTVATLVLIGLADKLGRTRIFDDYVKNLVSVLLQLHSHNILPVSQCAMSTCHELVDRVNPLSVIEIFIYHGVSDAHRKARIKSIEYLCQILLNIVDVSKHRHFIKHQAPLLDRIASVVHANAKSKSPDIKKAIICLADILRTHFV